MSRVLKKDVYEAYLKLCKYLNVEPVSEQMYLEDTNPIPEEKIFSDRN